MTPTWAQFAYLVAAVFLLIYAVFISRNVILNGRLFFDNMRAQLQLERQTDTISLLLKEFQENASDWLWQTDAEGRLVHVPERFVEVAQIPRPLLQGAYFAEALAMVRNPDLTPALAAQVFVVRPPQATPTGRFLGTAHIQRLLREPPSALVSGLVKLRTWAKPIPRMKVSTSGAENVAAGSCAIELATCSMC